MIKLQGVSKRYHTTQGEHLALDDIHLEVKKGEIFGIIGRSGAGKSTLIRCVNLLERPTQGLVTVDNIDLTALNADALRCERKHIGMIFQQFNLLSSRSVYDNIALPLSLKHSNKTKIRAKVDELLALTGLENRASHYPHQLSGGQKQRVAIARALACEPKVLLSDEATSSLDPETTLSILSLLKNINQELGLTILLITHEMQVIKHICDRAAVLDHGKIVEIAPVIELFTRPKSEVAKSFTQAEMHVEVPAIIKAQLKDTPTAGYFPLFRLAFVGEKTEEPFIVSLYTRFKVVANILQANMEMVHDASIGIAICQILGESANIAASVDYLHQQGIQVEALGYAPNHSSAH